MTYYLTFPDKATWETACAAAGWASDGRYAYGEGIFASILGQDANGFQVNLYQGSVPAGMSSYEREAPEFPREVIA